MASRRVWIGFDLGLIGEFEPLYEWLDQQGADECGYGLATFETRQSDDAILRELRALKLAAGIRLYFIRKTEEGAVRGTFVRGGRRTRAPWHGSATRAALDDE